MVSTCAPAIGRLKVSVVTRLTETDLQTAVAITPAGGERVGAIAVGLRVHTSATILDTDSIVT